MSNSEPNRDWARVDGCRSVFGVSALSDGTQLLARALDAVQRVTPTQILQIDGTIFVRGAGSNAYTRMDSTTCESSGPCLTAQDTGSRVFSRACPSAGIGDASRHRFSQPKGSLVAAAGIEAMFSAVVRLCESSSAGSRRAMKQE